MHNGAPEWNFKLNSSDMYYKQDPNKKICVQFFKLLYLGQTGALTPKTNSTLNPRKEFQGQIIVCKTLLHSVSFGPLTVG